MTPLQQWDYATDFAGSDEGRRCPARAVRQLVKAGDELAAILTEAIAWNTLDEEEAAP